MRAELVLAELLVVVVLFSSSIVLIVVLCNRSSLRRIYIQSVNLFFLLLTTVCHSIGCIMNATPFIILSMGWQTSLSRAFQIESGFITGLVIISLRVFYDCATWALFVQRILTILYPFKKLVWINKWLIVMLVVLSTLNSVALFVLYLPEALNDSTPIPAGCFSFTCMTQSENVKTYSNIMRSILGIVIIATGSLLLVLIKSKKIITGTSHDAKLHAVMRYFFFLRIVLEIIPYAVDLILFKTIGISAALYVGSYGLLGNAIDVFVCTLLLFRVISAQHKVITPHRLTTIS